MIFPAPYTVFGDSRRSPDGEPYDAVPRSLMGRMSSRVQKVLDALSGVLGELTATNIRDKDIQEKTGLNRRTIQRALHDLQHKLGAIDRIRDGARRIIVMSKKILEGQPREATRKTGPSKRAAATSSPAPIEQNSNPPTPIVEEDFSAQPGEEIAARVIETARSCGWEIVLEGEALELRAIPGMLRVGTVEKLRAWTVTYAVDIRAMIERTRPARE